MRAGAKLTIQVKLTREVIALHGAALAAAALLMQGDPPKRSVRGRTLLRLVAAIERLEKKIWPIGQATKRRR